MEYPKILHRFTAVLFAMGCAVLSNAGAQVDWTLQSSGVPELLSGVAYGEGRWVVVGAEGNIITSTDTVAWTAASSGTTLTLRSVIRGAQMFVAVGENGTVLTSPDGLAWTTRSSGVQDFLSGIAFGEGRYVAVGTSGTVITSTDAISWSETPSGTFRVLQTVTAGGGKFVAAGFTGTVIHSDDGLAWSPAVQASASVLSGSAWLDGSFYVVGLGGTILASDDGENWTPKTSGTFEWIRAIATDGHALVVVGDLGTIRTSPDGETWTPRASVGNTHLLGVAFGNGNLLAVGERQSVNPQFGILLTSPTPLYFEEALDGDCLAWTTSAVPFAWQTQTDTTNDGVDAAASAANLAAGQTSSLETTVHGPATLTFSWKISAGSGDDLVLSVDDIATTGITGEQDWTQDVVAIDAGPHVLRWTYTRGGEPASGQNRAWLDQVVASYTYDDWARAHFDAAELADLAISGPDADPDEDGLPNVGECFLNTDPKTGGSLPTSEMLSMPDGDHVSFTFQRNVKHQANLIAVMETSTDLQDWQTLPSNEEILSTDGPVETVRISDTVAFGTEARRFFRFSLLTIP